MACNMCPDNYDFLVEIPGLDNAVVILLECVCDANMLLMQTLVERFPWRQFCAECQPLMIETT
jgi:hypothetical protein